MLSRNHDELLKSTISEVAASFAPDELAFLALTSKPEQHFRDRMAFRLYQRLQKEEVIVCREWKRVDLAVVAASDQQPLVLVELKWMYSMDVWANKVKFYDAVLADEAKALHLASVTTSVYTLLLATHPKTEIPPQYWATMKYASSANRCLLSAGTAKAIAENAISAASARLGNHKICASGEMEGGTAYSVPASVMWWLVKAVAGPAADFGPDLRT